MSSFSFLQEFSLIYLKFSGLRKMRRVVELALHSLQAADYSSIELQEVLHEVNSLHQQASVTLSELDLPIT